MKKNVNIFDSISSYNHSIGIYLTYTMDSVVLDKLSDISSGSMLVLHDYTQGKSLETNTDSKICCLPIVCSNRHSIFHSKLIVLKSETGAKIITGSLNLAESSFKAEKEVVFETEIIFDNPEGMFFYNSVLDYLSGLKSSIVFNPEKLEESLKRTRISRETVSSNALRFINNRDSSILDEIKSFIEKNYPNEVIKSTKIVTPFISSPGCDPEGFPCFSSNLSIYLRRGTGAKAFIDAGFKVFVPVVKSKYSRFHAKLVSIEFNAFCLVYIGSANFTVQGFLLSSTNNGNQECGVLVKTLKDELNAWFNPKLWEELAKDSVDALNSATEPMESQSEAYAWAQKQNGKIFTYIYNPNKEKITQNKQTIIPLRLKGHETLDIFFTDKLKLNSQKQQITFEIGKEPISIAVFYPEEFLNYSSIFCKESIFYQFSGIRSVLPKEMDSALLKERIASPISKVNITEPPRLEQYYANVKDFIENLEHRKHITNYNEEQIVDYLQKSDGARGLYLALSTLRCLQSKTGMQQLLKSIESRIDTLTDKLNIPKNKFDEFKGKWLK